MDNQQKRPDILQIAKDFIKTVENRKSFDEVCQFFHPDVIQIEYPNSITKNIKIRTLQDLKKAAEQGRQVLREEHYQIVNSYVCDKTVILEVIWKGISAIEVGQAPAGSLIKAFFTQFFEFKGDKIYRQRNYDCFEAFNIRQHKKLEEKVQDYETNH